MSFTAETRERTRPALPLAGMIDVLFLLLIFFMTASVFRQQELQIDVQLPAAESAQAGGGVSDQIIVTLREDRSIYLGPRELTLPELREALADLAEGDPDQTVVIRGDQQSHLGLAVELLDIAQQAGFTNAEFAAVKAADEL